MSQKKRGLGRGLGELGLKELLTDMETAVPTTPEEKSQDNKINDETSAELFSEDKPSGRLCEIPIESIFPGRYQPRKHIDEQALQELADSIRSQGVIQPIVVRRFNNDYEIIAGERRWRAAQLVGMKRIPAIVRDLNDEAAIAMSLIENIQRADLNPLEEAQALQRLLEEFQLTHQEVADVVGKSRVAVTNLLRLLKLNEDVKQLVEQNLLEMGHARALLTLDSEIQPDVANAVVSRQLSVRETEKLVKDIQEGKISPSTMTQTVSPAQSAKKSMHDPDVERLKNNLSEKLNAKIMISHKQSGKGKLIIHYNSLDELDGIIDHIN